MTGHGPAIRGNEVMGRAAVLVLFCLTGAVALARLAGVNVSSVIANLRGYGGLAVELVWAVAVVVAALIVITSWAAPGWTDRDRAVVEVVGLLIHALTTAYYAFAVLLGVPTWTETLYLLAFLFASIINCSGRAVFLMLTMPWAQRLLGKVRRWWVRRTAR